MGWPVVNVRLALLLAVAGTALLVVPAQGTTSILGLDIDQRFLIINLVVLTIALIDFLLAPSPANVLLEREHKSGITIGEQTTLQWRVSREPGASRGFGSRIVRLADDLPPSLRAEVRRVALTLPGDGSATATTMMRPSRRGRYSLDRLTVQTAGPLGLIRKQRSRELRSVLRVMPTFRSAKEAELTLHKARVLEVGLRSARGRGGGTEFDSLREMTVDDETRRIDWAATARSNRPIIRTFRAERNQTVLVALDSGRVMAGRVQDVPRLEFGMDGAMLLAELTTGLGDRMGFMAFDRTVHSVIEPSMRRSQRSAVTEAVFDLQPALAESDYRGLVTSILARYRRRTLLVLITELSEEVIEQFVLPSLPLLARKHVVLVAAIRDPDVERWSTETTVDEDGAYLRASALQALHSRKRAGAKLRSAGALVIDATPADFATQLGDAYLTAKAVGRI